MGTVPLRLGSVILIIPETAVLRPLVCSAQPRAKPQQNNRLSRRIMIQSIQQDLQMPAEVVLILLYNIKHLFKSCLIRGSASTGVR